MPVTQYASSTSKIVKNIQSFAQAGDVRSVDDMLLGCRDCDVIYNLAAEHKDDVRPISLYDDVNVQGARNVCEAAAKLGITEIIFTSSVAIYGFSPHELDEQASIGYINDYGRTKYEAEQVYLEWVQADSSRRLRILRPTAVFGEGNRGNVYNLIRQLGKKHFVMVGAGENGSPSLTWAMWRPACASCCSLMGSRCQFSIMRISLI